MSLKEALDHQIKKLNAKLKEIYTFADGKQFDIREELQKLEILERVYSVIEADGIKEGKIYEEYSKYLSNVRERITFLKQKKAEIERENAADIKNIELLLEKLQ